MARTKNQNHVGPRAEDVAVKGRDPLSPQAQGLYDPAKEHDSCGVGFVANLHNAASHDIVEMGLQILLNLDHRGAVGADPKLGDGCGILVQIPHEFFAQEAEKLGIALPKPGEYAIGQFFLPRDPETRAKARAIRRSRDQGRGADGAGLARLAGRFQRSWRRRARGRAFPRSSLRRTRRGRQGRGRFRAAPLPRAQDLFERDLRARGLGPRALLRFALDAHDRL